MMASGGSASTVFTFCFLPYHDAEVIEQLEQVFVGGGMRAVFWVIAFLMATRSTVSSDLPVTAATQARPQSVRLA